MTPSKIKITTWAREFKRDCPSSYAMAIDYASQERLEVTVGKSDATGVPLWAVAVADTDFWMDALPTKKAALALCKQMGWRIVK
jgi:hypothetical protein